jgi:hypothetical protein
MKKSVYETPCFTVTELWSEGVLCGSGDPGMNLDNSGNEQFDNLKDFEW